MILLETGNLILQEAISQRVNHDPEEKRDAFVIEAADFDGVLFKVSNDPSARSSITVSMRWKAWGDLKKAGVDQYLTTEYGSMVTSAETGYDVSLKFDAEKVPGDKAKFPEKIANLKTVAMSAAFDSVFKKVNAGQQAPPMTKLAYRDNECIYIKPQKEQVIVVFQVCFRDPEDEIIGRVFLQEFADAKRNIKSAPHVTYNQRDAPMEIQGEYKPSGRPGEYVGFVTFVLFKGHLSDGNRPKTIQAIQTFRNFLHYHIKCAKAYLHNRMRNRVFNLLQVLNRARMERKTEKKTATGRTFKRG